MNSVKLMTVMLSFLVLCRASPAQTQTSKELQDQEAGLIAQIISYKTTKTGSAMEAAVRDEFSPAGPSLGVLALTLVLARAKPTATDIQAIEGARTDKQVGTASSTGSGTTSLTTKGSVPSILGLAVENGAITQSQSGTTITFDANPIGIMKALGNHGFIQSYSDDTPTTRFLRRLSFDVSFDTNRGNSNGTFTGDAQQVSSFDAHADIRNKRDPRNPAYQKGWSTLIGTSERGAAIDENKIVLFFSTDPVLHSWLLSAQEALITAAPANVQSTVQNQLADLSKLPLPDKMAKLIDDYGSQMLAFLSNRDALLKAAANGSIISVDYTDNRQVQSPDLSTFKLIAATSFMNGKADVTANASATILNTLPAGMNLNRLHDVQFSAQADIPLGQIQQIGSFVLTFSGLYERLLDNNFAQGTGMLVPNTEGDMAVGQLKLTIPVKGTGVNVPISVTFANRTDLIKESDVRANFGVTFDLDTLFSKLKP